MKRGIVSTGSQEATQAAADILGVGGNAFDAAVSAVFTSMTSEFALTGAGGGGAMMVKKAGLDPLLYDFFVDTPDCVTNKELDFFDVELNFGDSTQKFHIGKGSAAVPGTLLGLVTIHKNYGTLPLSIVMEPAIHLAQVGSILNKKQAYIFKLLDPIFSHTIEGQKMFYIDGKILKEGQYFKNLDFANFLERVSKKGAAFFYNGEGAELIKNTFKDGGLLNEKAMGQYCVEIRKPVSTSFLDTQVYLNPPPSSGGTLIVFLLRLLEEGSIDISKIINLVKAMDITNIARKNICSDSNDETQIKELLEKENFIQFLDKFINQRRYYNDDNSFIERGETTHVSIVDKDLNVASVTTTNGEGCGYILPGTGIMLNNMLGERDLNPQGFHNWKYARRLSTMMSPSIVTKHGKPILILGSGGSNRIRSAIAQVLINYLYKKMTLKESIESSRIHFEGNKLYYEPGINISKEKFSKDILFHPFKEKNLFFGGVNAVTLSDGFSDERRGGSYKIV